LYHDSTSEVRSFPMPIITTIAPPLQSLFGPLAEEVAADVPVVKRRRKFSPATLARTFILGFLAKPHASDEDLARTAARCGVLVSPQAVGQRYTDTLATFLERLFRGAIRQRVRADRTLGPLVERFPAVTLLDSTSISLPAELGDRILLLRADTTQGEGGRMPRRGHRRSLGHQSSDHLPRPQAVRHRGHLGGDRTRTIDRTSSRSSGTSSSGSSKWLGASPRVWCHWTLRLLTDEPAVLGPVDPLSAATVRQAVNKTTPGHGSSRPGASRRSSRESTS
jgi:hypothetical protein